MNEQNRHVYEALLATTEPKLFDVMERDEAQLHPRVPMMRDDPRCAAGRRMLEVVYAHSPFQTVEFVKDFQSRRGLAARLWELALFAAFREMELDLDTAAAVPDYLVRQPARLSVEATTTQAEHPPEASGSAALALMMPSDEELPHNEAEWQQRVGRAVAKKMRKKYWLHERVDGYPFVVAVEAFHTPSTTVHADGSFETFAYGLPGVRDGLFFTHAEASKLSALLFSNGATWATFGRIGVQEGLAEPGVRHFRFGALVTSHDAAIHKFGYHAGEPGTPREEFRDSLRLFHNPSADHPLLSESLPGITETWIEADGTSRTVLRGLSVIMSSTHVYQDRQ